MRLCEHEGTGELHGKQTGGRGSIYIIKLILQVMEIATRAGTTEMNIKYHVIDAT